MAALEGESVRTLAEKKRERTAEDRREPFSAEDLNTLFKATWFETGRGVLTRQNTYREFLPYYYWLPLIGIYQGARINEICQLYLDDISQDEDGTWGIDINENREDQRLKNKASRRCIPVHPEPPRVLRRLQPLRRSSHEQVNKVLTRSPRACRAHGARAPGRPPFAVGGR